MKVPVIVLAIMALLSGGAFACEFTLSLSGGTYANKNILPGGETPLSAGTEYVLIVTFKEDHRNCAIPPEETLFLLDEERFRTGKDYMPLRLSSLTDWVIKNSREQSITFTFTAALTGRTVLAIERECPKGGFNRDYVFTIS